MGRVGALTLLERREEQSLLQPALPEWTQPGGGPGPGHPEHPAGEPRQGLHPRGSAPRERRGPRTGRIGVKVEGQAGVAAGGTGRTRGAVGPQRGNAGLALRLGGRQARGPGPESLAVGVTLAFRGWNWDSEGRSLERVLATNCQRMRCVTVRRENRRETRLVSGQRQTAGADVGGVCPRRHGQDRRWREGTGSFCTGGDSAVARASLHTLSRGLRGVRS